ncbi:YflJ family protein [Solibacillus sp. MA9]|uniref:YflJ family protein n=1 Tax=Solibacillus palustris TaxID=2908203 RepID=A0ABS9UD66_9BACL|nr:DUF2639 domain-containing protein [Solibacillus sp. MA9]MCH7322286.1 YflJ family protein [Solibacillus sp. MA9]
MYTYSKGWYVKELRKNGMKKHPQFRTHLGLYKTSELRRLYYQFVLKED